ncbi:hypothetical protein F66182_3425 [Fusarium sp. NRRL 66182]|nr:hypothetical protein F66182_3425 [Fusarium sp. NRRL 66182]
MKFSSLISTSIFSAIALANNVDFTYERLDKNDAALLVVDIQEGLYQLVRDFDPTVYRQQAIAHAALADLFNLPVVMTTSADSGPNGPLLREIREMHPNASFIQRQGEVNSWDNADFRHAVQATNKSQMIIAGIMTDVCTTFLALSLREAGFSVWANIEASGTISDVVRHASNDRMAKAGVHTVSAGALLGELMRDWRSKPGAKEVFPWIDKHVPITGHLVRAHGYAVTDGELLPGQEDVL